MELTEEQLAALLEKAGASALAQHAAANPPAAAPAPTPPPAPATPADDNAPITKADLAEILAASQTTANASLTNDMFGQQLGEVMDRDPQFKEFINSNDEFGANRLERLNQIDDYKTRMATLKTIQQSHQQAQIASAASNPGGGAPIPKATADKVAKVNKQYDDIDAQLDSGDISPEQHSKLFFSQLFDNELEGQLD